MKARETRGLVSCPRLRSLTFTLNSEEKPMKGSPAGDTIYQTGIVIRSPDTDRQEAQQAVRTGKRFPK